ncbi:MAG: peroxiredoxin, partial [Erysipelotrichaceae bacterium]
MLTLHDKAPDFSLKDQDGHLIKLSDYKGSYVVIYFYPKDNTPGCTIQACHYRDFMTQFNQHQIKVFGISKDDEESHQKFTQDFNLNFQLLVDSDLSVIKAYDVWQEKNMYGKIMMGVV